jgi:hypothetical protein
MTIIILGFLLVLAGLYFALGNKAVEGASGSALKGISVQGPAWLLLVALGVGAILFGAWLEHEARTEPTVTTTTTTTTVPEPFDYGDDPDLDDLYESCFDGDWTDCDELYLSSPEDSEYEWFGATCGYRIEGDGEFCADAAAAGTLTWEGDVTQDTKLPNSD